MVVRNAGILATVIALGGATRHLQQGNRTQFNKWLRYRVAAQGVTVIAGKHPRLLVAPHRFLQTELTPPLSATCSPRFVPPSLLPRLSRPRLSDTDSTSRWLSGGSVYYARDRRLKREAERAAKANASAAVISS